MTPCLDEIKGHYKFITVFKVERVQRWEDTGYFKRKGKKNLTLQQGYMTQSLTEKEEVSL